MSGSFPDPAPSGGLPNLFGLDRKALEGALGPLLGKPYQAALIYRWMYGRRATSFAAMTDLPQALRLALDARFRVAWPVVREASESADGSRKLVLTLEDGGEIEAVHIVYGSRVTFCISSQIGCTLDCRFCLTGTMGLVRNLTPGEIAGQVAVLAREGGVDPPAARIVFMGMGEPLANFDSVMRAFRILADPEGFGIAARRVTVSTAGIVPGIEKLARESPRPRLAVSLGAPRDPLRSALMPINRKFDLERLTEACRRFPLAPREKITFEYVLLEGMNDGAGDARRIAGLMRGLRAKVNLIPYNEAGVPGYRTPSPDRVARFRDALMGHGIPTTVRWSHGRDIGAACGQLVRRPVHADGGR